MQDTSVRDRLCEPIPCHLFSPRRIDKDLVADFLMVFARAEFALKRAKFVSERNNGRFDIDWDGFARSIGSAALNPIPFNGA